MLAVRRRSRARSLADFHVYHIKDGLGLQIFGASSSDEPFFLFSNGDCVAMGGGSAFALYLDRDLLHGMSGPCSTFGSEMLSSTENFIINDFECWVFDDP